MSENVIRCAGKVKEALSHKVIEEIAFDSGFFRRLRKFTPARAIWTLVTALGSGVRTLADIHRLFMELTGETIGYKPFHDRLSQAGFAAFMKNCLSHFITQLSEPVFRSNHNALENFKDIVIQDGSTLTVADSLADVFPGRFTKKSPGAVKIHCTYSLYEGQTQAVALTGDKESERDYLPEPEELQEKLLLIDAGYFGYEYFQAVEDAGGDYICPLRSNTFNPTVIEVYGGPKSFKGKKLKQIELPRTNVDLLVEGRSQNGTRYTFRLLCKYVLKKNRHVRLATSLRRKEFSVNQVALLYRLRWQIELFFKECKSFTNLKKFTTKDPHIVEGLICATLLAVVLRRFLLYSAFRKKNQVWASFIAGAVGWFFFRELARVCVAGFRGLKSTLHRTLDLLLKFAPRTNPKRADTFDDLCITPV